MKVKIEPSIVLSSQAPTLTAKTPAIVVNGMKHGRRPEERRALADALNEILLEQAASRKHLSENCQQEQPQPPYSTEPGLPVEKSCFPETALIR